MRILPVSIQKEDGFFIARCPDLGVTSQGRTLEEARANIKEDIELYIESFYGSSENGNEFSLYSHRRFVCR